VATVLATEWNVGNVLWTMLVLFFWVMAIWIFIAIFSDIFRRNDLSGWAKAGWIFLIFIVPFLGALIYVIARPKMTEQDKQIIEQAQEAQRRIEGYSAADEIAKLAALRDKGEISADEYNDLKRKATMELEDTGSAVRRGGPFGAAPFTLRVAPAAVRSGHAAVPRPGRPAARRRRSRSRRTGTTTAKGSRRTGAAPRPPLRRPSAGRDAW
jgi:uncharacterized membrane protein